MEELLKSIKDNEGFSGEVYKDHLGFDTVGYGTKMPLDKEEAELLVIHRLKKKIKELERREPFYNKLPLDKQAIIAEMSYQLGVNGVLKFKKMWSALKDFNYPGARIEMLNSKWAIQTPKRAKELSEKMSQD